MVQIQEVRLVDDLDGSEGSESVSFALDGRALEIDLSEANAAKLRDALAAYVAASRRAARTTDNVPLPDRDGTWMVGRRHRA